LERLNKHLYRTYFQWGLSAAEQSPSYSIAYISFFLLELYVAFVLLRAIVAVEFSGAIRIQLALLLYLREKILVNLFRFQLRSLNCEKKEY